MFLQWINNVGLAITLMTHGSLTDVVNVHFALVDLIRLTDRSETQNWAIVKWLGLLYAGEIVAAKYSAVWFGCVRPPQFR